MMNYAQNVEPRDWQLPFNSWLTFAEGADGRLTNSLGATAPFLAGTNARGSAFRQYEWRSSTRAVEQIGLLPAKKPH